VPTLFTKYIFIWESLHSVSSTAVIILSYLPTSIAVTSTKRMSIQQ